MDLLTGILEIALSAAPWLLLGLLVAGLIKPLVPHSLLERWLGGSGVASISRGAIIGAPLPLCSCGAIPTALTLHRGGAGRGPTAAFLISTPGIGVDSVALTYALLGPFMLLSRIGGAIVTAISTGLLMARFGNSTTSSGGATTPAQEADCCNTGGCCEEQTDTAEPENEPLWQQVKGGIRYAFSDLLDDIAPWMLGGLVIAGVLVTMVPAEAMATYGTGLGAILLLAVIGIPMYICAAAATPIGAGMLMAGVSPGAALVFLIAGPVTSLATLGILRREMGNSALALYLLGVITTTVLVGLGVDQLVTSAGINVVAQVGAASELFPPLLEWLALALLVFMAIPPARRLVAIRPTPA